MQTLTIKLLKECQTLGGTEETVHKKYAKHKKKSKGKCIIMRKA